MLWLQFTMRWLPAMFLPIAAFSTVLDAAANAYPHREHHGSGSLVQSRESVRHVHVDASGPHGILRTYEEDASLVTEAVPAAPLLVKMTEPRGSGASPSGVKFTYEDSIQSDIHPVRAFPHAAEAQHILVGQQQTSILKTYDEVLAKSKPSAHVASFVSADNVAGFWNADNVFIKTRSPALVRSDKPDGSTAGDTALPQNSKAVTRWEKPRNQILFIMVMCVNTAVAMSLYIGARLHVMKQSQDVLTPDSRPHLKQKDTRLQPSAKEASSLLTDATPDSGHASGASSADTAPEVTRPVPSSDGHEHGTCRGFEGSSAWRDPTVDLQVGDSSFEAWSTRRRSNALKRLGGCAFLTAVLLCVEVSVGVYLGSLALMSNGFHLVTDVAMYVSLFVAVRESDRAADRKSYSFGLHRLEVVGVLIALISQYIISGNLIINAFERLATPHVLVGGAGRIICLTSTGSLIVNSSLAVWLGRTSNMHNHSHSHGGIASHMAWLHLVTDAVQNGLVILTGGLLWIDPSLNILDTLCTFAFAILVVASTVGFFRQLLGIVMECAPADIDCEQMFKDVEGIRGVIGVHCCHAWSISQGKVAVSAHIHVDNGFQDDVMQEAQTILKHRYGIHHLTLQISDDEDLA